MKGDTVALEDYGSQSGHPKFSQVIMGHLLVFHMKRHLVECESAQMLERVGSQKLSTDLSPDSKPSMP